LSISLKLLSFTGLILIPEQAVGELGKEILDDALVSLSRGILDGPLKFLNLGLSRLVREFATNRVEEINASKGTGDERPDGGTGTLNADLGVAAHMGEDITLAHLDEGQFDVVGVSRVI
jgi:hypothetical protein